MSHPIESLMNSALKNIKEMIDVNTIVGQPISAGDGITIIPISRVAFGLGVGGSSFGKEATTVDNQSFGGGSGAGVSISPVAFLVVSSTGVRLMPVNQTNTLDKIIDMAPDIIENFISKFETKNTEKESPSTVDDDFVIG